MLNISPDFVRISMAAAIELGLKPGKIHGCGCGCINLLQNYPEGCFANCSYCGLARERPGLAEENSFIRVDFLDLYTQGDDVTLWYSEDLGNQWNRVRALTPKSALQQERVHLNKASKRIRFRLKGSSTNFQLGWMGFSYTPEFSW